MHNKECMNRYYISDSKLIYDFSRGSRPFLSVIQCLNCSQGQEKQIFLERISLNQSGNDFDARKVRHAATTPQATVGGSLPETGDTSINVY